MSGRGVRDIGGIWAGEWRTPPRPKPDLVAPLLASVPLELLARYLAGVRGLDAERPANDAGPALADDRERRPQLA